MCLNFDSYHSEQSIRLTCCKIEALSVWILGRRTLFRSVGRRHPFSGHRFHKLQSTETKKPPKHDVLIKFIHHKIMFFIKMTKKASHMYTEKQLNIRNIQIVKMKGTGAQCPTCQTGHSVLSQSCLVTGVRVSQNFSLTYVCVEFGKNITHRLALQEYFFAQEQLLQGPNTHLYLDAN